MNTINTTIAAVAPEALEMLARIREIFPGAMLGESSVYVIPVNPDFNRDIFREKLRKAGVDLTKTHYEWEPVWHPEWGLTTDDYVPRPYPARFEEDRGAIFLRTDGNSFIAVPIGEDGDLARWMADYQQGE